jgi:hypothetical protein
MEEALNNQNAIFNEIYSDNAEAGQARADACYGHDDYIWAAGQGSGPPEAAPAVTLSTYHVCSLTGQQRADEIFAEVYAPKLDELVKKGDIAGWGWNEHRLGGRYRRLGIISGADHASVVAANSRAAFRKVIGDITFLTISTSTLHAAKLSHCGVAVVLGNLRC